MRLDLDGWFRLGARGPNSGFAAAQRHSSQGNPYPDSRTTDNSIRQPARDNNADANPDAATRIQPRCNAGSG